jgi:hypothetical protein
MRKITVEKADNTRHCHKCQAKIIKNEKFVLCTNDAYIPVYCNICSICMTNLTNKVLGLKN